MPRHARALSLVEGVMGLEVIFDGARGRTAARAVREPWSVMLSIDDAVADGLPLVVNGRLPAVAGGVFDRRA